VLELVAEGLPNAEIARRLFISEKTAKVHVHHIFEKLGVGSRLQAALAAKELLPEAPSPEP
jgi:DNA-binding NarL/FixJ family response regulator